MSVWIGMTGGMDKHWGDKELPCVGHQLASCSLLISYSLMFLCYLPNPGFVALDKLNLDVEVYYCCEVERAKNSVLSLKTGTTLTFVDTFHSVSVEQV